MQCVPTYSASNLLLLVVHVVVQYIQPSLPASDKCYLILSDSKCQRISSQCLIHLHFAFVILSVYVIHTDMLYIKTVDMYVRSWSVCVFACVSHDSYNSVDLQLV